MKAGFRSFFLASIRLVFVCGIVLCSKFVVFFFENSKKFIVGACEVVMSSCVEHRVCDSRRRIYPVIGCCVRIGLYEALCG